MKKVVLIDNYDSFTWNLVHLIAMQGAEVEVFRNDAISVDELRAMEPSRIVISPGPGWPKEAGITIDMIRELGPVVPILGVCLGHQAIAEAFSGEVSLAGEMVHGKARPVFHNQKGIFANIPSPFQAGRYHSLVVTAETPGADLEVTATAANGEIMAVRHRKYPVYGVQFHPESILTEHGDILIQNFLAVNPERNHGKI